MKFGAVYRRRYDGLVAMFIGEAKDYYDTDEMGISSGTLIALTLDRGMASPSYRYWPLHGTANANELRNSPGSWEMVDE